MLGEKIKKLREKNNMTQKQLSNKSGISVSYIQQLEYGKKENPSIETLNKIASALGVTINRLVGNKKTKTQQVLEILLKDGFTLNQIANETNIDINDLENMLNNKPFIFKNFKKLFEYLGYTDEEIVRILMEDIYVNTVYNNDGTNLEQNKLKKMFLDETLSLDEILLGSADEDKDFLTQMYYAGALNTNGVMKDNNYSKKSSIKFDTNDLDILDSIEPLLKFMKINNYPVDKLNNKTIRYLYEKIRDLLEFEFYKLEKNNFKIPNNKEK